MHNEPALKSELLDFLYKSAPSTLPEIEVFLRI